MTRKLIPRCGYRKIIYITAKTKQKRIGRNNVFECCVLKYVSVVPYLVTDPPEIIRKPSNQGVRVGGVATFFCGARGDPQPSIVWRKNGKKIMGKWLSCYRWRRIQHIARGFWRKWQITRVWSVSEYENILSQCYSSLHTSTDILSREESESPEQWIINPLEI